MKGNLLILLIFVISLFLLPVVQASGSPTHDHGKISPFQKHGHRLHCELNKHHLSNIDCPHGFAGKNQEKYVLAPDCGGKTSGILPAFGSYNANVFSSDVGHFNIDLALINRKFACTFYGPDFFLPDQVDHPPQTV